MNLRSFSRHLLGSILAVSVVMASATSSYAQSSCVSPRDVFLNPFNKNSAHHRPIGTGAQYAADSHATTRDWLKASRLAINTGSPWGVTAVTVDSSDPVVRIAGKGPGIGLPASIRLPRGGLQTNIAFNAFGTTDGTTVIYDRTNGRTYELFQYDWNNGNPNASILRSWDIRGLGHGTSSGQRLGTTAAGTAMLMGALRGQAINKPGHPIEHALQMVLPRRDLPNQRCNIMLSRNVQLPATTRDGSAGETGQNTGSIPYGALFALPRSINVNSLGLSEPGRRLAQAFQNYGIYVVDGGGCGNGAMRTDQEISSSVRNQLHNDMPKIYRHMRMVLNNNVTGSPVAGGGTPLAPNCAFDAGATGTVAVTPTNDTTSTNQSASNTPSTSQNKPTQQASTGNAARSGPPAANTPQGRAYAEALDYWERSYWNKKKMDASRPGTADHNLHKRNYERTISLYIDSMRKAGYVVDRNTSPQQAVARGSQTASNTAQPSTQQQVPATTSTSARNTPPAPGTAAADNWEKAKQFYQWAMWDKTTMERTRPGTPEHERAKAGYERNSRNYVEHAARAGVRVTIDIPPDRAFG